MGMSNSGLKRLTQEIMKQGYAFEQACEFAALIGDTPCFDEAGLLVVEDEKGNELARLRPLKIFQRGNEH